MPMGGFTESETTQQSKGKSKSETEPWQLQENYLEDIFGQAKDVYGNVKDNHYDGDFVAGFNPDQLQQFNSMLDYARNSPIASMLLGQGGSLGSLGQSGIASGMAGLQGYQPSGTTQGMINDAGQLSDNPYMSGMVDSAMRDARRATYEGQLPANARAAALSGNTNSSKRQVSDAIAERGLADRTADVSAGLRGQAYQQGLGLSQNQSQFNDQSKLQANQLLGSLGLDASKTGMTGLLGSLGAQGDLFGMGNEGGAGLRDADQAGIDNELAKYTFGQSDPWSALMNYYNIIGNRSWGSETTGKQTGTTTGTTSASPASAIGGILTGIGGLF
jgi:hypothetical protein